MCSLNQYSIEISLKQLPDFTNAKRYLTNPAYLPGGFYKNRNFIQNKVETNDNIETDKYNILFDPQTSGGLVIALNPIDAKKFIKLMPQSYPYVSCIIGRVVERGEKPLIISE
jgi:selenide,water dikinase